MNSESATRMGRSILKWLAVLNVAAALLLATAAVSQKKTVTSVNENTLKTLSDTKDQHTDFVRHMLVFVTRDTSRTTNVAFFAAVWLAVNAVASWRCSSRQHRVGETEPTASPK